MSSRYYSSTHSKKSGGAGRAVIAVGTIILAGGATLAYAKYDPDFKKILIQYIPFTEPLLKDDQASGKIFSDSYKNLKTYLFESLMGKSTQSGSPGQIIEQSLQPQEYKGKF